MVACKTRVRREIVVGCLVAGFMALIPGLSAAETCDLHKEILALFLSINRYSSTASEALTLKRLSVADAMRAKIDYEIQQMRLSAVCRAEVKVKNEQSTERAIMTLALQQALGMNILLAGGSPNEPTVKAGYEAG